MKLPGAELAVVESEKITAYLLNGAHPDNGGKAAFFAAQGFRLDEAHLLATALRNLADTGEVVEVVESPHGRKYILEGNIETPSGKRPLVRSIWIVDRGLVTPRLVTAYPRED